LDAVETKTGESPENWRRLQGDWRKWMIQKLAPQYTDFALSQLGNEMRRMDDAAEGVG